MNATCAPTSYRRQYATPSTPRQSAETTRAYSPASDIIESDDKVVLNIDLPGIAPAEISIKMVDGLLTIKAQRERATGDDKPQYLRRERMFGEFERRFRLPRTVDTSAIKANFKHGTLSIVASKTPQAIPRTIEINRN